MHCRSSISSNCLVFPTSGGISSSPAAFLFLILLRTESSSLVKGPSFTSNCLLIILVIGSSVISGGFPSRFLKCCSHSFTLSCWLAAFNFALAVLFLPLTSFIVCQAILDCLMTYDLPYFRRVFELFKLRSSGKAFSFDITLSTNSMHLIFDKARMQNNDIVVSHLWID